MFTYTSERPNIIKLPSNDYREGESSVKKTFSDLALPLHAVDELLKKCSYVGMPNYGKKVYKSTLH
jgi:hypothetical protein